MMMMMRRRTRWRGSKMGVAIMEEWFKWIEEEEEEDYEHSA